MSFLNPVRLLGGLVAVLLGGLAGEACANDLPKLKIDRGVMTEGFLAAHPDIRWQMEGMHSYERDQHDLAFIQFQRAARHGDKTSQAMIASMYWDGIGVDRDRELGYAWMDIAAERMYPDLLVIRERYWLALDARQQRRSLERGRAIMDEYGDAAAQPRLEVLLKRRLREATSSRTGALSSRAMMVIPFTGPHAQVVMGDLDFVMPRQMTVSGDEFYNPRYWQADEYWALHDEAWKAPVRRERVEIGGPETLGRDLPYDR